MKIFSIPEEAIFFKKKNNDFKILVVCTANITRSPYVEALLRKTLLESGLRFRKRIVVESAGVKATPNQNALHEITVYAKLRDQVILSEHRSRKISAEIVNSASLILAMEQMQVDGILKNFPDAEEKTFRITAFGRSKGDDKNVDVSDPTGSEDPEDYYHFFGIARTEVNRVLEYMLRSGMI